MLNLTEKGVDVFIKRAKSQKIDPYWDSYDLIIWQKNDAGYFNQKGAFRKNNWGISQKIIINKDGIWKLPKKYVKYFK